MIEEKISINVNDVHFLREKCGKWYSYLPIYALHVGKIVIIIFSVEFYTQIKCNI